MTSRRKEGSGQLDLRALVTRTGGSRAFWALVCGVGLSTSVWYLASGNKFAMISSTIAMMLVIWGFEQFRAAFRR